MRGGCWGRAGRLKLLQYFSCYLRRHIRSKLFDVFGIQLIRYRRMLEDIIGCIVDGIRDWLPLLLQDGRVDGEWWRS